MELALFIYLAGIADDLKITLGIIAALVGIVLALALVICAVSDIDKQDEDIHVAAKKTLKWALPVFLVCTAIALFTPSKNTLYLMAGGYAAQEVATGEIGSKVLTVINLELDKMIEARP